MTYEEMLAITENWGEVRDPEDTPFYLRQELMGGVYVINLTCSRTGWILMQWRKGKGLVFTDPKYTPYIDSTSGPLIQRLFQKYGGPAIINDRRPRI